MKVFAPQDDDKKKKRKFYIFPSCINSPPPSIPSKTLILVNYIDSDISQETASMVEHTD